MGWTDSERDWNRFLGALSPGPGEKILDVGAGIGTVAARVLKASGGAEVHAVDPGGEKVSAAKKEYPSVRSSVAGAERLPFEDSSFDKAYATMSLHHFADLAASLKEIARVLKPGGTFLILEVKPGSWKGLMFRVFGRLRGERMNIMSQGQLSAKIDASGLFELKGSFALSSGYLLLLSKAEE